MQEITMKGKEATKKEEDMYATLDILILDYLNVKFLFTKKGEINVKSIQKLTSHNFQTVLYFF